MTEEYVDVEISKELFDRIEEDRKHFEEVIGGEWTINDTIVEYLKVMKR